MKSSFMQKIAAIDVGSNAIRMIVGGVNEARELETLENIRLPVRLGEDAFGPGRLREVTIQRALDAFLHFQRIASDLGVTKVRAIATSAMREAANGDILVDRIQRATGITIEVISGEEEARLIHMAVANAVNLKGKHVVLIDIGGGSVEVTIAEDKKVISTESYNMGTVRLLQNLDGKDKFGFSFLFPKRPFSLLVREYAEAARRRIDREIGNKKVDVCIGTGGNVEEMGKLRQRLFKRESDKAITLTELQDLIEELSDMTVKERIRKLKLRPDRADVILPAAIVLQLIAREARVRQVVIPHVGLKDGLLLDMTQDMKLGQTAPRKEQVLESTMRLGQKYQFDAEHAKITARLATRLFDKSTELHNLGQEERLLLEVGALLHDIGHFINTIDHDKHGYYILKANPLIGLTEHQQEIVANLIRYHRKAFPSPDDPNFRALPQKDRVIVTKLCALIRLADGMDVSHTQSVSDLTLTQKKKGWVLHLRGRGDLMLEKWALEKRRALFQEVFGVDLEIE
ncbi:MAG TPA: Ppx/GppA phosphatase family protein [Anaerolineales bacterium]|nr:Ppx/GppA phosphatase family protein [Anaerolineales bacterium]